MDGRDDRAVWCIGPRPDAPPSALRDRVSAEELAAALTAAGFAARVEEVVTPALHDVPGGTIGFRVRVGSFATLADANAELARLQAAQYSGSSFFTGWDGDDPSDTGPWVVQALSVDPTLFDGELDASFGPDLERRETTSALAQTAEATAAVNAGYFVFSPLAGAPGDPAGVGVSTASCSARPSMAVRRCTCATTRGTRRCYVCAGRGKWSPRTAPPCHWTGSTGCPV